MRALDQSRIALSLLALAMMLPARAGFARMTAMGIFNYRAQ